jgi:hypothetical protein
MLLVKKLKEELDNQVKATNISTSVPETGKTNEFQSKAIGFNIPIDSNIPSTSNSIFHKVTYTSQCNAPLPTSNDAVRSIEIDSALKRAKEVLNSCNTKDLITRRPIPIENINPSSVRKIKTGSEDSKENIKMNSLDVDYQFKNRSIRPPIKEIAPKRMKIGNTIIE